MQTQIGIVIPTIRTLDNLDAWQPFFSQPNVLIYIVEDHETREIKLPKHYENVRIWTRSDMRKELGRKSWIFPRFNSAIRGFGFWKAWKDKCDVIVTLDDDCFPGASGGSSFLQNHENALNKPATLHWWNTAYQEENTIFMRGFPYMFRNKAECVLNHGLWQNVPDLDGPTQLLNPTLKLKFTERSDTVPQNSFYPMCGMNIAFKSWVAPVMYFGLQGPDWPYNQFDDIWAGILSKKVFDHLNLAVRSGSPAIEHRRASNVYKNLKAQAPGIEFNERFWPYIEQINLTSDGLIESYKELTDKMILNLRSSGFSKEEIVYIKKWKEAIDLWLTLYK